MGYAKVAARPRRRAAAVALATRAGFGESQVAFVTAFQDRNEPAFKKAIAHLAWAHMRGA